MRLGLGVSPTFVKCFGCFEVGAFQSTAACCCLFLVFLRLLSDFPACSIPHFLHSSFLCFFVCLFACLFACLCACLLVRFSFVVRLLFFSVWWIVCSLAFWVDFFACLVVGQYSSSGVTISGISWCVIAKSVSPKLICIDVQT